MIDKIEGYPYNGGNWRSVKMERWEWESVEARVACMITRTQKRGRRMGRKRRKPHHEWKL